MRFLRENLFLMVLIAAVVVLGGVMIAAGRMVSSDVDEGLQERLRLSNDLRNLSRDPMVNEDVLAARRSYVQTVQQARNQVRSRSVAWNVRNYELLSTMIGEERIVAFPVQPRVLADYGLDLSQAYVGRIEEMLASMNPTSPARKTQIEQLAATQLNKLLQRQEDGDEELAGLARSQLEQRALAEGRIIALQRQATDGQIYANLASFDRYFIGGVTSPPSDELWQAQVNLWITSDIVAAINETNQQALRGTGGEVLKPNVINAAVKRLDLILIDESYYGSREVGDRGGMTGRTGARAGEGLGNIGNLSRRTCNQEFDVLRYRFAVIMPARHLNVLQQRLMARNYHTILNVDMERAPRDEAYYYGADPVMKVTFYGELLLLTAWERGVYLERDRQWSDQFPPLMPVSVLQSLPADALRREDRRRLDQR